MKQVNGWDVKDWISGEPAGLTALLLGAGGWV